MPNVESDDEQIHEDYKTEGEVDDFLIHRDDDEVTDNPSMNGMSEDKYIEEPRRKMKQEEIFEGLIQEEQNQYNREVIPKKKKRVLSEAHKKKLFLGREKALATRRKNKKEKDELKQLERQKKDIEKNKLKDYVNNNGQSIPKVEKVEEYKKVIEDGEGKYTLKDLEEAQTKAIEKYEELRKSRKQKKKKEEEVNKHDEQTKKKLQQALQPSNFLYGQDNYFDNCF